MMISGLVVGMENTPTAVVHQFFDGFGANTAQFWMDGLPLHVQDWRAANHPDFQWISWIQGDASSVSTGTTLGGVGSNSPGRVGFQVGDEPRTMEELLELQDGIQTVRATDPEALVIMNFGNGETESIRDEMLQYFATYMDGDIMSYDQYGPSYSSYRHLERTRQVAVDHGVPYWRYLNSFAEAGKRDEFPTETDMRWDALKGLVYGYTGHTWFLYQTSRPHNLETALFDSTGDWSANQSQAWHTAADLNRELAVYGRTITQLTSTDVRYIPEVSLYAPEGTTSWSPGAGSDPYITSIAPQNLSFYEFQDVLVGFFEDDLGEIYVMLQNPTHEGASWPIMVEDQADFRIEFDFSGAPHSFDTTQLRTLNIETETVVPYSLQPLDGQRAALNITLSAGDAILFKYATGAPFATQ